MDLTILHYTANRIGTHFAEKIREELIKNSLGIPIISISQKPIDFGENICVGEIGASTHNVYKQILIGARKAKTKYVVCCEDDSLYSSEHFEFVPQTDAFYYNINCWRLIPGCYLNRKNRPLMSMCIAPTNLMVSTLEERFKKFSEPIDLDKLGEPGKCENRMGLPSVGIVKFVTKTPNITIKHFDSLEFGYHVTTGFIVKLPTDRLEQELPFWGESR